MPGRQTVWLRALTATPASTTQSGQCGFVYVSSGYRGPRVSQRDVIGVDTDTDQSAGELSQAPIFLASMFVLWYVFCVASHMDISRDVVEGKPFCARCRHFCVCRGLKSRLLWADINLCAVISLCLRRVCRVNEMLWWAHSFCTFD